VQVPGKKDSLIFPALLKRNRVSGRHGGIWNGIEGKRKETLHLGQNWTLTAEKKKSDLVEVSEILWKNRGSSGSPPGESKSKWKKGEG